MNFLHRASCNLPGGAPCITAAAYPIRQSSTTAAYPIRQSSTTAAYPIRQSSTTAAYPIRQSSTTAAYPIRQSVYSSSVLNICLKRSMLSNVSIMFACSHTIFFDFAAQGAVSASTIWSGIILRSSTCIGKEQAPDCVLPADTPTHLTH